MAAAPSERREKALRSAHLLILPMPAEPTLHHTMGGILSNNSVLLEKGVGTRLRTEIGSALN